MLNETSIHFRLRRQDINYQTCSRGLFFWLQRLKSAESEAVCSLACRAQVCATRALNRGNNVARLIRRPRAVSRLSGGRGRVGCRQQSRALPPSRKRNGKPSPETPVEGATRERAELRAAGSGARFIIVLIYTLIDLQGRVG